MTTTCALCGAGDPRHKVYPPREWVDYLRDERGVAEPEGALMAPLCGDCHDRIVPLREAYRRRGLHDDDQRETTRERVEGMLDRLDADALRDESGPDADDVQSVL